MLESYFSSNLDCKYWQCQFDTEVLINFLSLSQALAVSLTASGALTTKNGWIYFLNLAKFWLITWSPSLSMPWFFKLSKHNPRFILSLVSLAISKLLEYFSTKSRTPQKFQSVFWFFPYEFLNKFLVWTKIIYILCEIHRYGCQQR